MLCKALMEGNRLEELEISENPIESKGVHELANLLKAKKNFTRLVARNLEGIEDDMNELLEAISANKDMATLDLSDNSYNEQSINLLIKVFQNCRHLATLDLSELELDADVQSWTEKVFDGAAEHCHSLAELHYSHNKLEDVTSRKCLEAALKMPKLKELEMSGSISEAQRKEFERRLEQKGIKLELNMSQRKY